MRILNFRADHPFFVEGLMEGLAAYGHDVRNVNPAGQPNPAAFMNAAIDRVRPDIVVTAGVAHQVFDTEALWPVLREKGVPHVYWAVEDSPFFADWSLYHARHADFVFTTAPECVPWYQERGIRADTLEFACNPRLHHHQYGADPAIGHDIALVSHNQVHSPLFAGKEDRLRFRARCLDNLVLPLVRGGYDIKIWGAHWDHPALGIPPQLLGGPTDLYFSVRAYTAAKIVLGVEWVDSPGGHLSCKGFEILGCRAFYLAPCTPALSRHFTHGQHLVCSRSPAETISLVDYYLSHPQERAHIAAEGQREVYTRHTYLHRAAEFTEKLRQARLLPASGSARRAAPPGQSRSDQPTRHKLWIESIRRRAEARDKTGVPPAQRPPWRKGP
ncbi:MAG TPA: glycosyltransferase [Symbiobacteriaceae bacterium]|jgi:spore maturation protein CgeB